MTTPNTKLFAKRVHFLESVGSTNHLARTLIASSAEDGEVVIADTQTAGYGRCKRCWVSPKGGLWFSVILFPYNLYSHQLGLLSLGIGLGVIRGLKRETDLPFLLKWPNDIYLNNKKLGGVLIESASTLGRCNWIIVGIGLNINIDKDQLPEGATSIKEESREVEKDKVFCAVLEEMEKVWFSFQKEPEELFSKIKEFCLTLGKRVRFPGGEGLAVDIDREGRLVVETEDGMVALTEEVEVKLECFSQ
jgi:BirA family biotin operon repressor/biotin-[acetyl-CoA-carboxylase] ligase